MTEGRMTHEQALDLAPGYVLGALEREEEAAVRDHLATCSLPHDDFRVLGGVVPALLELQPDELVEPPAGLRDRVMAAALADLAERGIPPLAERTKAPAAERTVPFPSAAERTARAERRASRTSRFDWALRIAAVIAIIAAGAWGLNLQGQLDEARRFDTAIANVIQAAGEPGAKTVVLSAQKGYSASGIAAVRPDGTVVLAMRDLPATSGTEVYTAWAIVGTNAPVSLGDFALASGGSSSFTGRPAPTPAGATIALTLEPNAGNTAPKGQIVSAGVAAAPPGANG